MYSQISTPSNHKSLSVDVSENGAADLTTPTNFSIYPSLRGKLFRENNTIKCVGEWAMTDSAHGIAGQTSNFEFKLTTQSPDTSEFPISGKYAGWFHLKQPMKAPLKIEDKELNIDFQKNGENYDIQGSGQNKFGKFSLYGTYEPTGKLQMYRVYHPKKTNQTPKSTKTPKTPNFASPRTARTPTGSSMTASPRETGQRIRKPSAILTGTFETPTTTPATPKRQVVEIQQPAAPPANSSGRMHRAPPFLSKCKDILKELSKQPLSIYFNDPVDPVKLNIPDYFTIIKEPMDFGTIRKNLESNSYSTHEQYAEHMRLVFRNAIAYNVRRDNPVHIAARELSDMFEERYRVMVSQLAAYAISYEEPILPPPKKSVGRARGSKSFGRASGPRDFALDGSAQAMRMMQQKMLEMEAEINSLRTAVRQSDIRATLGHQMYFSSPSVFYINRVAAQAPLTYEEKRILTKNIENLDGEHMATVVDIIQSVMPSACSDGEEIEIPVDELDTYTLRKLQDFVQNALTAKSKKRAVPPSPGRAPTPRSNPPKKSRTSSSATISQPASIPQTTPPPIPSPIPLPQVTPSHSSISSTTPTFFSNQSYIPPPEQEITGRKRSNSLDFFPADENDDPSEPSIQNSDAWKKVAEESKGENLERQNSGSWGDALYEKHTSESRKMALQAEVE